MIFDRWFAHPRFCASAAAIAVALTSISVATGFQVDDYIHRLLLRPPTEKSGVEGRVLLEGRAPWDLFGFIPGGADEIRRLIREGLVPWWAPESLRLSFFRPLTSLTHWVDYQFWPDAPALMHAQNLAWLALLVWIASRLYRELADGTWEAGLATLMFAVDHSHGVPAGWIAARNALISGCFGLLSVYLYVRGRRGDRAGAIAAPAALVAGLAGGEMSLGAPGYLLAYALFLDTGSLRRRLTALIPCAAATLAWIAVYKALGYGATGSHMYIDPASEPLRFAQAAGLNAPTLLLGQFLLPPADVFGFLADALRPGYAFGAAVMVTILLLIMRGRLRGDAVSRFYLTGTLLAVLPACGTAAQNRLLVVAGLGAMGLLARYVARLRDAREYPTSNHAGSRVTALERLTRRAILVIHLAISPPALMVSAYSTAALGPLLQRLADSFPRDSAIEDQKLMIVQAPTAFLFQYAASMNALDGRPMPEHLYVLGSSAAPLEIRRPDARTFVLRPSGGFLPPPGSPPAARQTARPGAPFDFSSPVSPLYMIQMFDVLFRASSLGFTEQETIDLHGFRARVLETDAAGRPLEIAFECDDSLESDRYRWMTWSDGELVDFHPPEVGQSVLLPAPDLPFAPPAR
ncbi:MAG: hypothetical protein L6Q93_10835 [Phycisphaerae bacterium]|nr:MAG: hypothetical protein EDS66_11915 [Planctomycetota bacterium]KAB2950140.1 MAG: hypothetical protein F9K17_00785 [Phycisphaerae bacterium]MCK6465317.1 hypothetical protein [Phycisphaerae bacterium]MCQ3921631.1 hypothetical protein [Planctomycetota bacterium]NUQ09513.1 hypothetical protein [Phycisphaerae bacterium]